MGESVLDKVIIESPGIVSWFIRIVAFVLALMWACVVTPIALIFLVLCLPIGVALLYIGTAPLVMTIKWFFHKKIRIAG